jgi:hypothetical protein
LTPKPVIITFLVVGIIFIPIGVGLLYSSNAVIWLLVQLRSHRLNVFFFFFSSSLSQVIEVSKRYDQTCDGQSSCSIVLDVPEKMKSPVFMYYGLDNFYQNHRRFVKSRNDLQLRGEIVDSYSALEECDPLKSKDNSKDKDDFYLPCGLIAASVFNGKKKKERKEHTHPFFFLVHFFFFLFFVSLLLNKVLFSLLEDTFVLSRDATIIPLKKEGIAWTSDVEKKFKNPPADAPGIRVIPDFEDEDFIVWMRTAGLPNFKKLYRIIEQDLEPGQYTVQIENSTEPQSPFFFFLQQLSTS